MASRGKASYTGETISIPLLDDLVRDLRAMPRETKYALQKVIDEVGNQVLAPHIRNKVVPQRGLIGKAARPDGSIRKGYRPGSLQRGIRAKVKPQTLEGIIESRARARGNRHTLGGSGFPYPSIYEYGGRGSGETGPRAFLSAGLTDKAGEIYKRIDDGLFEAMVKTGWLGR